MNLITVTYVSGKGPRSSRFCKTWNTTTGEGQTLPGWDEEKGRLGLQNAPGNYNAEL